VDDDILRQLDTALEEVRRRLRVRLRRELHAGGEVAGGGFNILSQLSLTGALSPSELADSLEVRTSTMTAHLDRLEEAGYVRRQPRAGGGASRLEVHMTEAGQSAYRRYLETRQRLLREVLGGLDPSEIQELCALLERAARAPASTNKREG
jgi:DNA-binding MarR family transcriptional regulator